MVSLFGRGFDSRQLHKPLLFFSNLHGSHPNLHPKIEVMGKQKAIGKEDT